MVKENPSYLKCRLHCFVEKKSVTNFLKAKCKKVNEPW